MIYSFLTCLWLCFLSLQWFFPNAFCAILASEGLPSANRSVCYEGLPFRLILMLLLGHQVPFLPRFCFIRGMAVHLSEGCSCCPVPTRVFDLQRSLSSKPFFFEARVTSEPFGSAFPFPMGLYIPTTPSHHVNTQLCIFLLRKTILMSTSFLRHCLWF